MTRFGFFILWSSLPSPLDFSPLSLSSRIMSSLSRVPSTPNTQAPSLTLNEAETVALRIRGYIFGAHIRSGSQGSVFHGTRHGLPCAIKSLTLGPKMRDTSWDRHHLMNEILLMKQIAHPNIVLIYDLYLVRCETLLYFMELMPGGDFFDFIVSQRVPLPEPRAAFYFSQMVSALAFLHGRGLAHRDLKMENLLLNLDKTVLKLADFGFLTTGYNAATGKQVLCHTVCGTLPYMSPQIHTRSYSPFAADVWALGIILYEMLHLHPPFLFPEVAYENLMEYFYFLMYTPINYSKRLSVEARQLCAKMLAANEKDRIDIESIAKDAWLMNLLMKKPVNG